MFGKGKLEKRSNIRKNALFPSIFAKKYTSTFTVQNNQLLSFDLNLDASVVEYRLLKKLQLTRQDEFSSKRSIE
jgi:hypothetical protein